MGVSRVLITLRAFYNLIFNIFPNYLSPGYCLKNWDTIIKFFSRPWVMSLISFVGTVINNKLFDSFASPRVRFRH